MNGNFTRKTLATILSLMMLSACTVKEINAPAEINKIKSPDFFALIDNGEARTYLNEECKARWNKNDCVSIFVGNTYNQKYKFNGETGDNSGSFSCFTQPSFVAAERLSANYSVYPYNARTLMEEDGTIKLSLPERQAFADNSFAVNVNTMVAVTKDTEDLTLSYRNVCGYLTISLFGDAAVRSIVLKGENGEKLAGQASIITSFGEAPAITMTDAATDAVTVYCDEAVVLGKSPEDATTFFFVVPPTVFSGGLSICVKTSDGKVMTKTTNKQICVERNTISKMAPFEFRADEPSVPDGVIQFKCQAVKDRLVLLFDNDADGEVSYREAAEVKSFAQVFNEFMMFDSNGNITFDPEKAVSYQLERRAVDVESFTSFDELQYFTGITEIPYNAFSGYSRLESVVIPENVTSIGQSAFAGTGLKDISLPEGLLSIGHFAFRCQQLKTVTIHDAVKYLDKNAFGDNPFPSNISFSGSGVSSDGSAIVNSQGIMMMYVGTPSSEYSIPQGVKDIFCPLPDGIETFVIPDGFCPSENFFYSSVKQIKGYGASADGHSLIIDQTLVAAIPNEDGSYVIPDGVLRIGIRALALTGFGNDGAGMPLTIPDSIIELKDGALFASGYSTIVIPNSVKTLGNYVCSGCRNLVECTLPAGIEEIPISFFSDCSSLSKVNNIESVKTLRADCFRECNSLLKHFTVPASVTDIDEYALFSREATLIELHSIIPPKVAMYAFGNKTMVYVPDTAYEKYSAYYFGLGIHVHNLTELHSDPVFEVKTDSDDYGEYISLRLTSSMEGHGDFEPEYKLRKVPSGSFIRSDGVTVKITRDFHIGQFEVPQWLWRAVLHYNPSNFSVEHPYYWTGEYGNDANPVESISWTDAQIFISRLSQLCNLSFRLPTEAEWEYAARGGSKSNNYKFSGSDYLEEVAICGGWTSECGLRKGNEIGLYDMTGNVAEYCQDYYRTWSSSPKILTDPTGPDTGTGRVVRGPDCTFASFFDNGFDSKTRYNIKESSNTEFREGFRFIGLRLTL